MKKKLIVWIPVGIVLAYIIFKVCVLMYYPVGYVNHYQKKIEFGEKTIKTDKSLSNTKYGHLNIYIPEGMVKKDEDVYRYYMVNKEDLDNEKNTKNVSIYHSNDCVDFRNDTDARIKNGQKLMDKNNLKNKYDLIRYYYDSFDKKVNVFSSVNDIKLKYYSDLCTGNTIRNGDNNFYYLSGDIIGIYEVDEYNGTKENEYFINVYNEKDNEYYDIFIYEDRDEDNDYPGDSRYEEKFSSTQMEKILSSIYFD